MRINANGYDHDACIPIDDILEEVLSNAPGLPLGEALSMANDTAADILKILHEHHRPEQRWLMVAAFLIIADRFAMKRG